MLRALALILACLAAACASRGPAMPEVESLRQLGERVPVVLVPGITGSKLRHRADGLTVWGEGVNLVRPKDGGYTLARPLVDPIDGPSPSIEASDPLEQIRLFRVMRKAVYGPVIELLEGHGYVRGDPAEPSARADFYVFSYDWRGDNIFAARKLRGLLEAIAEVRGHHDTSPLPVDLVCQSNGAHICRYLAKYGAVELAQAEAGHTGPPASIRVRKLILVGTSNGGGLRILRELDRGRRYLPLVGRFMRPEVLFSFPALYQDLPFYEPSPFLDESGRRLDLDLFDPHNWRRHGWSVFDPDVARRIDSHPHLFGDAETRFTFLRACLDRARRLHALLARDAGLEGDTLPAYYLLQNGYYPTPHLAMLVRDGSLLFTGDPELEERPYLSALASAPGDGHATLESQKFLSPEELGALGADPFLVRGGHFELILDPGTLRHLLHILAEETGGEQGPGERLGLGRRSP
ncbi:MAG: hypothetical protein MI919_24015 [Holophagales bacterium]|nr:hypothetical protein [Holophagales bacterium]